MNNKKVLCALFIACALSFVLADSLARGWGDNIRWNTLDDAKKVAAESNQPIMVIIHKTWCGACKRLKGEFGASKEIEELSSRFVMVNLEDDEEPKKVEYTPDGGYIPRIFFLEPSGKVRSDLYNKQGNPSYKYYYADANTVLSGMKQAFAELSNAHSAIGAEL